MGGPTARLITEVLDNAVPLCFHAFGHHVVECGIEHGSVEQQHDIALALQENILRACKHRFGTYVLQKALLFCPRRDQQAIAGAILSYPGNLAILARNSFGAFVVKTLLQMPQDAVGGLPRKSLTLHLHMKNVRRRGVCSGRCSLGVERIGRDSQRVPLWSFTSASPLLAVHAVLCVALSFVQGVSWYLLRSSAKYVCPLLHLVLWSASCTGMSSSKLVVPACPYAARALCFPFSSCESVALQR